MKTGVDIQALLQILENIITSEPSFADASIKNTQYRLQYFEGEFDYVRKKIEDEGSNELIKMLNGELDDMTKKKETTPQEREIIETIKTDITKVSKETIKAARIHTIKTHIQKRIEKINQTKI